MSINLISNLIAFTINLSISFFLTPYIVNKLGDEAYGFVGLANNFVSYIAIITTALNAMASRYISIELHREDVIKARKYFNSVLISNIIMSIVIFIFSLILILNLEKYIYISNELVLDVKITFFLAFFNFILTISTSVFNVATFVKNRLDMLAIRNIIANILKLIVTIGLFISFKAKIFYISIGAIISTFFIGIANIKLKSKLLSEIKIDIKYFDLKKIFELIKSGIWNSLGSLSNLLLTGLDLYLANLLISGQAMGILSIAKTVPTAIQGLIVLVASVFTPIFTMLYAKNKISELVNESKLAMKIQMILLITPMIAFIVFGNEFYTLWLPGKTQSEIIEIWILSILTMIPWILNACVECLYSFNILTNRVKTSVVVTFILGIISTILVFICVLNLNMGLYAIAGVSSIIISLRILVFVPIYAAHVIKIRWKTYYPILIKGILCVLINIIVFITFNIFVDISNWGDFILKMGIFMVFAYIISAFFILGKESFIKSTKKIKNIYREKRSI